MSSYSSHEKPPTCNVSVPKRVDEHVKKLRYACTSDALNELLKKLANRPTRRVIATVCVPCKEFMACLKPMGAVLEVCKEAAVILARFPSVDPTCVSVVNVVSARLHEGSDFVYELSAWCCEAKHEEEQWEIERIWHYPLD